MVKSKKDIANIKIIGRLDTYGQAFMDLGWPLLRSKKPGSSVQLDTAIQRGPKRRTKYVMIVQDTKKGKERKTISDQTKIKIATQKIRRSDLILELTPFISRHNEYQTFVPRNFPRYKKKTRKKPPPSQVAPISAETHSEVIHKRRKSK